VKRERNKVETADNDEKQIGEAAALDELGGDAATCSTLLLQLSFNFTSFF